MPVTSMIQFTAVKVLMTKYTEEVNQRMKKNSSEFSASFSDEDFFSGIPDFPYRKEVIKSVRLYGEMHRFIPAWLATVTSPDRMAEVPVRHYARTRGASKYGITRTFRVIVDLLAVYFFLRFRARPGHFFGVLGLIVMAAGVAVLAYLLGLKIAGYSIGNRPLLLLGFFFVMGGVQLLTTGVLAEIVIRVYFDGRLAKAYHATERAALPQDEGWHGA